ncbi:type II toxin-antitoxin system VapC family toxin [Aetokthonos hydrillicola Thurmond2011]|jgi:PIN domain nuclease of toxin-antitoxin system|uniref:Type II toxin-antitoxin system VapC family toxin n=1 Tax=Aetokthonos hydrillicola Thurmond2011 TaxID=2712845 RepID=A0AAP5MCQ6_9CYAN|nr:type II toxin-antitoxin system VapC family toxin [Aetokthonos hydrillicola]MBO3464420.1 type II toxin-antitoxin system VapC family toxin [Aetokthonos hydrillicola CCALA 1050]MBW4589800.1 type II toxin-antitoxin system VapC family toxin [Aetokthonos hydrillicola CCALA 1050]MDR9898369.1 type II toxin-antitoxin system VapC family toxin [Aetokthonos hydrillicola Thurmond2011]
MILLDTHIWLWWLHSPEKLSERSRTLLTIAENQNAVIVSAISVWEIALKHSAGKLPLPLSVNEWFAIAKTRRGITIEPVDPLDAIASTQLPGDFHKDPADRIIVAIAYRRNIELITCHQKILTYPHIKTLW